MEHEKNHEEKHHLKTPEPSHRHFYRSRKDRIVFGVCGGIADYFSIDPAIVRLSCIILALANGIGIIGYLIFAIAVKENPAEVAGSREEALKGFTEEAKEKTKEFAKRAKGSERWNILGIVLIFLGIVLLLDRLFPRNFLHGKFIWPSLLVLLGLVLVFRGR